MDIKNPYPNWDDRWINCYFPARIWAFVTNLCAILANGEGVFYMKGKDF